MHGRLTSCHLLVCKAAKHIPYIIYRLRIILKVRERAGHQRELDESITEVNSHIILVIIERAGPPGDPDR
jgi:hypothetical protein